VVCWIPLVKEKVKTLGPDPCREFLVRYHNLLTMAWAFASYNLKESS